MYTQYNEIKKFLDQYVVGQDQTKKILAVAVHNHYRRLEVQEQADKSKTKASAPAGYAGSLEDVEIEKFVLKNANAFEQPELYYTTYATFTGKNYNNTILYFICIQNCLKLLEELQIFQFLPFQIIFQYLLYLFLSCAL